MKVNGIMKRVFCMIGLGLICVVTGCVPLATDLRKEGFDLVQKGFDSLDESPTLYEVIALDLPEDFDRREYNALAENVFRIKTYLRDLKS
jgi:hypothetical protein